MTVESTSIVNTETGKVILANLGPDCTRHGALSVLAAELKFASLESMERALGGFFHLTVVRNGVEVE
jgi:hypothetical protein